MKQFLKSSRMVELLSLLVIILLGAYFRFLNHSTYPGLYNDEGTQINIAMNMMQGKTEYLGVQDSFLLFMRMPMFPFLLSILFCFVTPELEAVRGFSACLGLLTIGMVFFISRDLFDKKGTAIGLLAALALAIYPKFVMYNRLGISYNLLAVFVLLYFWGMVKYWQTKKQSWLYLAAGAIGLGGLVDLVAFTLIPSFLLLVLGIRRRDWWRGLIPVFLPFLVYVVIHLLTAPHAFLSDLGFAFFRVSGASIVEQVGLIIFNLGGLLILDGWFLLGIAGLFLVKPIQVRWIALMTFLPTALVIARTSYFRIGFYYLLPWVSLLAIGLGMLIRLAIVQILQTVQPKMDQLLGKIDALRHSGRTKIRQLLVGVVPSLFISLLIIAPTFVSVYMLDRQILDQSAHQIYNYFDDIQDAWVVQGYINQKVGSNDLVLASPSLAWMLKGHISDYQIALAAGGISTAHLPPIPASRLAYNISFQDARFVVVDAIWLEWGESAMPELVEIRRNLEDDWRLVLEVGKFCVYENPN